MSKTNGGEAGVTVITGATDGIGLALAKHYRRQGDHLVLIGRRAAEDLNDPEFFDRTYCQTDLLDPTAHTRVAAFLDSQDESRIERLILNAATGYYGRTAEQSNESIRGTIQVNFRSAVGLIQACYPGLKAAQGKVVLIGSVVAAIPGPDYAVYGATKAALDGLGRSLRHELAPEVTVKVIHPGATRSGLHAKIGVDPDVIDWRTFPPAEQVAESIAKGIERRSWRQVLGLTQRCVWAAGRRAPWLVDAMVAR